MAAAVTAVTAAAAAVAVEMDAFVVGQTETSKNRMAAVEAEEGRQPRDERLRVLLTTAEKGAIRLANTMALREQVPRIVGVQPGVPWGGGGAASGTQGCSEHRGAVQAGAVVVLPLHSTTPPLYYEQVHKRDVALEAAAMRGCGAISKGVFDRYGTPMLRHDERSLLPLVREFDASGDGVLRLSEFRLLLALRFAEAGREPPAMAEATRLFKAAVRDDNGRLGVDELAKILDRLGLPPDRPDYLK